MYKTMQKVPFPTEENKSGAPGAGLWNILYHLACCRERRATGQALSHGMASLASPDAHASATPHARKVRHKVKRRKWSYHWELVNDTDGGAAGAPPPNASRSRQPSKLAIESQKSRAALVAAVASRRRCRKQDDEDGDSDGGADDSDFESFKTIVASGAAEAVPRPLHTSALAEAAAPAAEIRLVTTEHNMLVHAAAAADAKVYRQQVTRRWQEKKRRQALHPRNPCFDVAKRSEFARIRPRIQGRFAPMPDALKHQHRRRRQSAETAPAISDAASGVACGTTGAATAATTMDATSGAATAACVVDRASHDNDFGRIAYPLFGGSWSLLCNDDHASSSSGFLGSELAMSASGFGGGLPDSMYAASDPL